MTDQELDEALLLLMAEVEMHVDSGRIGTAHEVGVEYYEPEHYVCDYYEPEYYQP